MVKRSRKKRKKRHKNLLYQRRAMEKYHAQIRRLLDERQPKSVEEANEYIQQFVGMRDIPPPQRELTAEEKAQDMMYDAWDEPRRAKRIQLARRALEIFPDCADAYVLLAEETAGAPEEAKELYEKGVAAGERVLGKEFIEKEAGNFWGLLETRPYMRARLGLAQALWAMGRRREAVSHYREMLRLNPEDNQGVRYLLIDALLLEGFDDEAEDLLARYGDDYSADWFYSRALCAYRRSGASKGANKWLKDAFEFNPFVPLYVMGLKEMPRKLPEYVGVGDENEAVSYIAGAIECWAKTPGAVDWMVEGFLSHVEREMRRNRRGFRKFKRGKHGKRR